MSTGHDNSRPSPALQLLASGLQLWIRQQCQAVDALELQLHGSALQLLRGRLEGVSVVAQGVVYQQLMFERVELTSTAIRVQMGGLLKGQGLQLEESFQIRGAVAFSGEGLNRSLTSPPWGWLGDLLAEQLLGRSPLGSLRIADEVLVLAVVAGEGSPPSEICAMTQAVKGSVEIRAIEGSAVARLPMDPSIRIDEARLSKGNLELEGEARVLP
ncbi:DUF2993 domain-containing protein [Cyanobium sp. ATX 6F1]|uniref:LmeA family phospholipid-binding protein n=1 Tax=unclassified Cyanobium TaxID=2627006 RepID=UPI0020CC52B6|nr:DUF2993 domain-containing protein [Cyanobium sp. ATX 6F1]MCP9915883.1 DUF2993 domain-containing protein [Cyanobium sp. ATX 6F1]